MTSIALKELCMARPETPSLTSNHTMYYFLALYKMEIGHNLVMEFSWDGTPLSRIKVPSYVTKICKDPVNNVLYALEENTTERLLKWRL